MNPHVQKRAIVILGLFGFIYTVSLGHTFVQFWKNGLVKNAVNMGLHYMKNTLSTISALDYHETPGKIRINVTTTSTGSYTTSTTWSYGTTPIVTPIQKSTYRNPTPLPTAVPFDQDAWWKQVQAENAARSAQSQASLEKFRQESNARMQQFESQAQQGLQTFQAESQEAQKQFLIDHGITPSP